MAMVGATELMEAACDSRSMAKVVTPSAMPAVTSGSSMPNSDPNASRMMTAAAAKPMPALLDSDTCDADWAASPPTSTCRPAVEASRARSMTRTTSAFDSSEPLPENITSA